MSSPHRTLVVEQCCIFTIFYGAYIRLQIVEDMVSVSISKSRKAKSGEHILPFFSSLDISDT
jgi:hypothetical protein